MQSKYIFHTITNSDAKHYTGVLKEALVHSKLCWATIFDGTFLLPHHKGGRPPPFVDSSIWVSPWVRVRVFGTPGQRCVVLPMGFSVGLSTQHWTICPLSYGCPPIKPARELEMSRPPKSTGGCSGRELEMSALYVCPTNQPLQN